MNARLFINERGRHNAKAHGPTKKGAVKFSP
jgi:hypothetical protein